jgi:DNA-binding MarR family transcriptional regulator
MLHTCFRVGGDDVAGATVPHLEELDAALLDVRAMVQRPHYRQRLLSRLGRHVELGTLRVLRAVERAGDDGPSVGSIAEALAIDPSSASRSVERCVAEGLLARRTSEQDRRRTKIRLTSDGRSVLDSANTVRRGMLAEVTKEWTSADVEQLVDLLMRLRAGFDRLEAEP